MDVRCVDEAIRCDIPLPLHLNSIPDSLTLRPQNTSLLRQAFSLWRTFSSASASSPSRPAVRRLSHSVRLPHLRERALPCPGGPPAQSATAPSRASPRRCGVARAARLRAGEIVGRGANVHAGIVENEVVEVNELAFEPQAGAGVGEVRASDAAVADWALDEALVEPRERGNFSLAYYRCPGDNDAAGYRACPGQTAIARGIGDDEPNPDIARIQRLTI